jgi:GTP-binding protein HflX
VASFRATLEEAIDADLLLHVIDAAHPGWEQQKEAVDEVLVGLGLEGRRTVLVFNKMDRVTHEEERAFRQRAPTLFDARCIFVSALEAGGLAELKSLLSEEVRARRPEVRVAIPLSDGEALATVYREGEVLRREENGSTIDLVARLPLASVGRLRRREGIVISSVA